MISVFEFKENQNKIEDGIIQHLIKRFDNVPLFSHNAENENPDARKMYTSSYSFQFNNKDNPVYLEFDFKKFRISIDGYKFAIKEGRTPPSEWEIYGRNSIDDEWIFL